MKSLKTQMLKLVKENLPAATAGEMKTYIEESEKLKKDFNKAEKELARFEGVVKDRNERLETITKEKEVLEKVIKESAAFVEEIQGREKILVDGELRLETTILQTELRCEQNSNFKVVELVEKVFGHPSVCVTNTKSASHPQYTDQNGYVQSPPDTFDTEDTITRKIKE